MNYKLLTITLCLTLFQVGCGESGSAVSDTPNTNSNAVAANAKVLAVQPAAQVNAKPGLPVSLAAPRQGIDVGMDTRVDLSLITSLSTGYLEVRITPSVGLAVVGGELTQQLTIGNAKTMPMSLTLRAEAAGKYYVNIEVVNPEQVDGLNRRALAAIVIAGDEGKKAQATEPKSGTDKHVLPAQETVH